MSYLLAVAGAALVGFVGNEVVARYRIRVGRQIGSAALIADGLHARNDGFTSLAVLLGVEGVAVGWDWADPVIASTTDPRARCPGVVVVPSWQHWRQVVRGGGPWN